MEWGGWNTQALLAVLLAMALGGAIGLERELANKPAGLRTNMLVAAAAALLVSLGEATVTFFTSELDTPSILRIDTIRIIEAVVTGVSFIGAGTIIRRGSELEVEGLTTAATLLVTAAIGIAAALRQRGLALAVTLAVIATLRGAAWLESKLNRSR